MHDSAQRLIFSVQPTLSVTAADCTTALPKPPGHEHNNESPGPGSSSNTNIVYPPPLCLAFSFNVEFARLWIRPNIVVASISPGTLRRLSIYGSVRNAQWGSNRVRPVHGVDNRSLGPSSSRHAVHLGHGQRVAVSCGVFAVLEMHKEDVDTRLRYGLLSLFSLTVAIAFVEKLCATMSLVSVERGWLSIY
ncbi:hypothetical protein GGR55DRAFT_155851 [Xylaria sp. FL0064]|nr:hypothetical protein GGR55DRAFT_155851 [Xylaria sp. FL0064]